jgi:hypothetical protein
VDDLVPDAMLTVDAPEGKGRDSYFRKLPVEIFDPLFE